MSTTFIDKCLIGEAFLDEFDDYVEKWHESIEGQDMELHEYLGMTWDEYSLCGSKPSLLSALVLARKNHVSLVDELNVEAHALAARASTAQEALKMIEWLKSIGKLR